MRLTSSLGNTYGVTELFIDACGVIEEELGAEEFAVWLDHQMSVAVAAVAVELPSALRQLVSETMPEEGESSYEETFKFTYRGTTIKVRLKLRLNVMLADQQQADLVGSFLSEIRQHFMKHMEDKSEIDTLARMVTIVALYNQFFAPSNMFGGGFQVDSDGLTERLLSGIFGGRQGSYPGFRA